MQLNKKPPPKGGFLSLLTALAVTASAVHNSSLEVPVIVLGSFVLTDYV